MVGSGTDKSSLFLYKNDWNRSTFNRNRAIFPLWCKRALSQSLSIDSGVEL